MGDFSAQSYAYKKVGNYFAQFYYFYLEQVQRFNITCVPYQKTQTRTAFVEAITSTQRVKNYQKRYAEELSNKAKSSLEDTHSKCLVISTLQTILH